MLLRPYYCSSSSLELSSLVRSMTSHSLLEVTSLSFLPSPAGPLTSRHACWFSCQMQNPLGKSHALQPSSALVSGDDGAFEFAMSAVELCLVGNDVLVEGPESHNVRLEPTIVCSLDHIKEGSVSSGWPLKGFVDPMG